MARPNSFAPCAVSAMAAYQAWNELPRCVVASAVRGVRLRGADDDNEKATEVVPLRGRRGEGRGADLGNCQSVAGLCRLDKSFRGPLPHWIAKWRS
jgi:hypothetical protein